MKNWKRLPALLSAGAMLLSLCACKLGESGESPAPSAEASASAAPIVADLSQGVLEFSAGLAPTDTLLTVNGDEIPADLLLYMLSMNCMNIQMYLPYLDQTMEDVGPTMLEESISMAVYHTLIRQKAAELGCLPTDAQSEEIRAAMAAADLETNAPLWGLTDGSAEFIFAMNTYYNNVLDATTHEPSTEELNGYLYRVKHILLKTVDDNRQPLADDVVAGKKAQAEDVLAQLQAADDMPALFDQLMNELSEDGRKEDGTLAAPDGYLAAPGDMVAEFEEASKALKEGELSGLVETEYGYHIILRLPTAVTEEEKAAHPEYAEGFREDALSALVEQWKGEADISRADALDTLDVADFYTRQAAYQQALSEQLAPAESPSVESGGVG